MDIAPAALEAVFGKALPLRYYAHIGDLETLTARIDDTMYMKTMKLFIEAGAELDARDEEYQSTPLGWACRWGRMEAVELLLEKGAKTNLPDDPSWATPLAWATRKGHDEIAELLKEHGATI